MKARNPKRIAGVVVLWGALVCAMGIDGCEEPIVFPVPEQQSISVDDTAELMRSWSFESCDDGWSGEGDRVWECAEPSTGPRAGVEGEGSVLATVAGGTIPSRFDGSISSPTVDLEWLEGDQVFVSLWHWYNFAGVDDGWSKGGGRVEVFHEGVWKPVVPAGGYDGAISATGTSLNGEDGFNNSGIPRTWRRSFFDVTDYLGSEFRIRLHAVNKSGQEREGWHVDDIEIWHGTFGVQMPETSMGACEPGTAVSFALGACDEGWGVLGDGAWRCGLPTRNMDPEENDGPLSDSPAFDRDGSRQLWGTELSGDLPRGIESSLVSPAIDAGRCVGGSLKLGFWHWYHFGPGGGGFVQVFDGEAWVDVAPPDGYPGEIGGGAFWREAYGHEAYVSEDDRPSGWRYEVIDLSRYAHDSLRVRFVVSTDNGETRPGWYVDTIEVVRDLFDSVGPMTGTPDLPQCGLNPVVLSGRQTNPNIPRDPCASGEPLTDWMLLSHISDQPGSVSEHGFTVEHEAGAMCIAVVNGATPVDGASVEVNGTLLMELGEFTRETVLAERKVEVPAGSSRIVVDLDGDQGSDARVQVRLLTGNDYVPILDSDGEETLFSNVTFGRHDSLRPGEQDPTRPRTERFYDISFDYDVRRASKGVSGLDGALAYIVQIMDASSCRQVREIRGWQGYGGSRDRGYVDGTWQVRTRWDGRDEAGELVDTVSDHFMRIAVYPANIDNLLSREDEVIIPMRAGGPDPWSDSIIDIGMDTDPVDHHDSGVVKVINKHGPGLLSMAGGETMSVWLFFKEAIYVDTAPTDFFSDLDANPMSSYEIHPTDWTSSDPYPYLDSPHDILMTSDLQVSTPLWSGLVDYYGPSAFGLPVMGSMCGQDSWGLDVCADALLYVDLPEESALYKKAESGVVKHVPVDFTLEHSSGFHSNMDTGIPQNDYNYVGWPSILKASNHTTPSLGGDVRWDERASIKGVHLWTYTQEDTPAPYRLSLCSEDSSGTLSTFDGLTPVENSAPYVFWYEPVVYHHGNFTFPIDEWSFDTVGGVPADTPIGVRAYYSDTCDPSAEELVTSDDMLLMPSSISGVADGVPDPVDPDIVRVEIEPGDSKELSGEYLYWYRTKPTSTTYYLTGRLAGAGDDNVLYPFSGSVHIDVPPDTPEGEYLLVRELSDLGTYLSEIEGPQILVNVRKYAHIDMVTPSDEQWRSEPTDTGYEVDFHVDENLQTLLADPAFKVLVGANHTCSDTTNNAVAILQTTGLPGGDSGTVWFKIPYTVEPGMKKITFCSEKLSPGPYNEIDDFRVLGYKDSAALAKSTKKTCSGDVGTTCSWTCGAHTITAEVVEAYDSGSDAPGITEYSIDGDLVFSQQTEPVLCNGIHIVTASGHECGNIFYCDGYLASNDADWWVFHRWGESASYDWDVSSTLHGSDVHENGFESDFFMLASPDALVVYVSLPNFPSTDGDDAGFYFDGGAFWPDQTILSHDLDRYNNYAGDLYYHGDTFTASVSHDHVSVTSTGATGPVADHDMRE